MLPFKDMMSCKIFAPIHGILQRSMVFYNDPIVYEHLSSLAIPFSCYKRHPPQSIIITNDWSQVMEIITFVVAVIINVNY